MVIVAIDALIKNQVIARYWKITSEHYKKVNDSQVTVIKQRNNTTPAAEAITLLNLVWFIYNITKTIREGQI